MTLEDDLAEIEKQLDMKCGLSSELQRDCYGCSDCMSVREAAERVRLQIQQRDHAYEQYCTEERLFGRGVRVKTLMASADETLPTERLDAFYDGIEALARLAGVSLEAKAQQVPAQ